MLTACLLAAALAAGVTGAWSPCGFSMVETLAPHGYARRLRTSLAACATFALGALARRRAHVRRPRARWAPRSAPAGRVALGVAAVVAPRPPRREARGLRIAPQIRRQVPEAWRRVLPVPLAAAGYGVLLGLGFTTFVLSFAVWALAGASIALGDPALGLAIGLAFGAGRALPVDRLAPFAGTDRGGAITAAMCERPAILLGLRRVDAVALAACALALGTLGVSAAARRRATSRAVRRQRVRPDRGRAAASPGSGPNGTALLLRGGDDGGAARHAPGARRRPDRLARRATTIVIADAATPAASTARTRARRRRRSRCRTRVLAWRTRDAAGTDRLLGVGTGGGAAQLLLESPAPTRDRPPGAGRHAAALPHRRPARQPRARDRPRRRRARRSCAASPARRSPTRRPTAAGCSTSTRPARCRSCALGPLAPPRPGRRRGAARAPLAGPARPRARARPPAATARATAGHRHRRCRRARRPASSRRCGRRRSAPDAAYVTRLRARTRAARRRPDILPRARASPAG